MSWSLIKRMFTRTKIAQPFADLKKTMADKDPELWERVRKMSIPSAVKEWRKAHPEDFTHS